MSEETKPTPKTGLAASIAEMAGPIFDKMNALPPGTQPPKPVVVQGTEGADKPKTTVPGVNPAEKPHEDSIKMEGMDLEMPPEIKSDKGRKDWKHYKEVVARKVAELQTKIGELEKRTPAVADTSAFDQKLAALEKEKTELNERLGLVSLEHTPEFEHHFLKRAGEIIEETKVIVGAELAPKVAAILQMPDGDYKKERLAEFAGELDDMQRSELGAAIREFRKLQGEKEKELKKWRENLSAREEVRIKAGERQKKELLEVFDSELASVTQGKDSVPLFQTQEGQPEWNAYVEKMKAAAKELYLGENVAPRERAKAALWATTGPMLMNQISKQTAELAKLREQLEQMRGKQPNITGGGGGEPPEPPAKPASLAERIANMAKTAGAVR